MEIVKIKYIEPHKERKKNMIRKKITAAVGIAVLLLLTGCQPSPNNTETEALKEQITQLEEQVAALKQENAAAENNTVSSQEPAIAADNNALGQAPATDNNALGQAPATDNTTQEQTPAASKDTQEQSSLPTTHTMEELTSMVNAYIEKAKAATPNGTATDNMEQFFSLKQEEKQIDDALDLHEDELEKLYRQNALTRDEYKRLEQELEKLEDNLDSAEDQLEYTFGIDD